MGEFNLKVFGKRLKSLVADKGFTQQQFADKCKISAPTLRGYFNGESEPTISTLILMSNALKMNINELIDEDSSNISSDNITPSLIYNAIDVLISAYGSDIVHVEERGVYENSYLATLLILEDDIVSEYFTKIGKYKGIEEEFKKAGDTKSYQILKNNWKNLESTIYDKKRKKIMSIENKKFLDNLDELPF